MNTVRPPRRVPWLALVVLLLSTPTLASEAGDIVDRMVAAHGGMEAWASAPSVTFTDEWGRPGSEATRRSVVQVEQGRRRALLEFPESGATIGWDGERAWSLGWTGGPPRFLALLNYYFVCLPWLAEDPGVVLGRPETATLWDDPVEYISIRMTYEPGVGDTPDDYYVLFIHPDTYRLHGCEYIVTYPGLVPEGMKHTPPHILLFESFTEVSGLTVPASFTIYNKDDEKSVYASCTIGDWSFSRPFDAARVAAPDGAVIDYSLERATILELESARQKAMVEADRTALERILDEGCTYTHSTSMVQSRAELIDMLVSGNVDYVSIDTGDVAVATYAGAAIVTGRQTIELVVRGKPLTSVSRYTVAWVDTDAGWTCVAYQSTSIPEKSE